MTFPGQPIDRKHVEIKRGRLEVGTALITTGLKGADLEAERQRMDVLGEWMTGANRPSLDRFCSSRGRWQEWEKIARPEQLPPAEFSEWTIRGARQSGRSRAAAEYLAAIAYEESFFCLIMGPERRWLDDLYGLLFDTCKPNIWRERDGNKIEFTNGGAALICKFDRTNDLCGRNVTHIWLEGLHDATLDRRKMIERDINFLRQRGAKLIVSNA